LPGDKIEMGLENFLSYTKPVMVALQPDENARMKSTEGKKKNMCPVILEPEVLRLFNK
jgi:hypothetical protein